ncbi:hypothetical protein [Calothrix sp. NIES-3974]|uniref:hypothetical protein n=1 Tax=Calothrix sp. NIES-3974 TaxID=2005462 RepID=UPI0012FE4A9B|nr:hypothetical protein [Calothrix sp. NIES-3974]
MLILPNKSSKISIEEWRKITSLVFGDNTTFGYLPQLRSHITRMQTLTYISHKGVISLE